MLHEVGAASLEFAGIGTLANTVPAIAIRLRYRNSSFQHCADELVVSILACAFTARRRGKSAVQNDDVEQGIHLLV
ncbi:MAG: hypothetical protein U0670_08410 [Anaerolineae bacterium]